VLISLPHAGLEVPAEISDIVSLSPRDIIRDGDEQAADIYSPLKHVAKEYVTTGIARAFVDLNRAEADRRLDGVVKTHTCFNVPVYKRPLTEDVVQQLLDSYYRPYHQKLTEIAERGEVRMGIDCHTMLSAGPPIGPDPGVERPAACLGNLEGRSCPTEWIETFARILSAHLGHRVSLNSPFKGGFITRSHGHEMPWFQLEVSRGDFASIREKSLAVRRALEDWIPLL
jgi:formiminoglutamase